MSYINQFGSMVDVTPPPAEIDHPARFRFQVTWAYVAATPRKAERNLVVEAPPPPPALVPQDAPPPPQLEAPMQEIIPASAPIKPAPAASANSAAKAQWEMVIPKMARPWPKRAPAAIAAPPAAKPPEPAPADAAPIRPLTLFAEGESAKAQRVRLIKWGLVAAAAIGIAFVVKPAAEDADAPAPAVFAGGWSRRAVSPPGRQMMAYDLSRDESNYRMEFSWTPGSQPVGWVFRTRDSGNYYAAKLGLVRPGDMTSVAFERFSVLGGIESPHSRKVTALMRSEPSVRIRMDASGPVFTLYVQGSPVDNWTDQRLPAGGFGFYEDRGHQLAVQGLRFTFLNKGALSMAPGSPR